IKLFCSRFGLKEGRASSASLSPDLGQRAGQSNGQKSLLWCIPYSCLPAYLKQDPMIQVLSGGCRQTCLFYRQDSWQIWVESKLSLPTFATSIALKLLLTLEAISFSAFSTFLLDLVFAALQSSSTDNGLPAE